LIGQNSQAIGFGVETDIVQVGSVIFQGASRLSQDACRPGPEDGGQVRGPELRRVVW
jgi:hypothetical protein